jgi:hypothetical protein
VTLHLTFLHRDAVVHVSDRLVTLRAAGTPPFDHLANKTVVLRADDALVSIGYTGHAYLEGVPSDEWIATMLWGRGIGHGRGFGGPLRLGDLGLLVNRLRGRLREVIGAGGNPAITIVGAGMQWNRRTGRTRPTCFLIICERGVVNIRRLPRYWGWETAEGRPIIVPLPEAGELPWGNRLVASLRTVTQWEHVAAILADSLREFETRHPTVGRHCMAVYVPRSRAVPMVTRFMPDTGAAGTSAAAPTLGALPAAYTPFIVAPGFVSGPTISVGTSLLDAGDFKIQIEAPDAGQGVLGWAPMPRPPQP